MGGGAECSESHRAVTLVKRGGKMPVSQRLAAALVNLEAVDVSVMKIGTPGHGMNVAGGCYDCSCYCYCDCSCSCSCCD